MSVRVVRLGTPRAAGEGLRVGTVRRPPRGVRKEDFARLNYFDVWLPELSPSPPLFKYATSQPLAGSRWTQFARRYRSEMKKPEQQRIIALLAALSTQTNFAVGCYCEDETRCHRTILRELLRDAGAEITE